MAQTLRNTLAETYIFDLMANLAYESNQLEKAERIFVDVIKRLMDIEKAAEDDIRLLHISTKIAHISYLQNDFDKAMLGFLYVLEKIEKRDFMTDDNYYEVRYIHIQIYIENIYLTWIISALGNGEEFHRSNSYFS